MLSKAESVLYHEARSWMTFGKLVPRHVAALTSPNLPRSALLLDILADYGEKKETRTSPRRQQPWRVPSEFPQASPLRAPAFSSPFLDFSLPFLSLTAHSSPSASSPTPTPYPPTDYKSPAWPSLFWPPLDDRYVLYGLFDMWRFTLYWTLVMFAAFHWAVIGIALFVQIGKRRTNWRYLWTIPIIYSVMAGLEALIAGSVTGAMSVFFPHHDTRQVRTRGSG